MGESKIPLYAYVDESGNTGHNLFDDTQPDFFTAAMVTKGDFDVRFRDSIRKIRAASGVEGLHGRELGLSRIESVSDDLLKLLAISRAAFYVSRIEKRYLLATKVFDCLLDSGENAGIAWHHYNVRPLRLMLVFKLATTIDLDTAKQFWKCILEPNEGKAFAMLPGICEALQRNLDRVPDERSRKVLGDGLEWARTHSESIQIYTDRRLSRQGHFPNLVAFANLLQKSGSEWIGPQARPQAHRAVRRSPEEFIPTPVD